MKRYTNGLFTYLCTYLLRLHPDMSTELRGGGVLAVATPWSAIPADAEIL